jgi:transglutaminase-like putative cysteine protease
MSLLTLFAAAAAILPSGTHARPRADSVVHDSIYKLAVNPADYPKDAYAFLLDEGVYRIEPDGRWTRTFRQVIQILKPQGAMQYREQRFAYTPDHEKLTINWMRVVKPTGEVISGSPEQIQESDVPASMNVPTYTSTKVRRLSLTGLDSGTVLDLSYTTEELKPPMPGDFFHAWRINPPTPVKRSVMIVNVPQSFVPKITERNLNFSRTERIENGRRIYTWAADNVVRPKSEMFAPDSAVKDMTVVISAPMDWKAVGNWYAPVVAPRYAITPPVAAKIKTLVAGAKTLDDSISAIQKWVSTDVRYVAILLGQGGYVPRDAETVSRTGFGDCKDKAMLFLAALKSIGVTGYPVLLNALGKVDESTPSIESFNHVIAAVQTGGGFRYSDLTVPDMHFGELPPQEDGKFGVLVREGASEAIHLPGNSSSARREDLRITGKLSADGSFNGVLEERLSGGSASMFRYMVQHPPDSAMRSRFARMMAGSMFDGADGDSLTFTAAPDSPSATLVRLKILNGKATTEVANLVLLTNPIHPFATPGQIVTELEKAPPRTLPFDLAKLGASVESHDDVLLELPDGWHAMLPKNVRYSGLLGKLELTFSQTGNQLRITRTSVGAKGVIGPERLPDVLSALKELQNENTRTIPIQKQ